MRPIRWFLGLLGVLLLSLLTISIVALISQRNSPLPVNQRPAAALSQAPSPVADSPLPTIEDLTPTATWETVFITPDAEGNLIGVPGKNNVYAPPTDTPWPTFTPWPTPTRRPGPTETPMPLPEPADNAAGYIRYLVASNSLTTSLRTYMQVEVGSAGYADSPPEPFPLLTQSQVIFVNWRQGSHLSGPLMVCLLHFSRIGQGARKSGLSMLLAKR